MPQNAQHTRNECDSQFLERYSSKSASLMDHSSPIVPHHYGPRETITIRERSNGPAQKQTSQDIPESDGTTSENESQETRASFSSTVSPHHSSVRFEAYERMLQNYRGIGWDTIELISAGCNHSAVEKEL